MLIVVADRVGGLTGNLLEDVVDEEVHDGLGLLEDFKLEVDLPEDSLNVDGEGLTFVLKYKAFVSFKSLER